MSDRSTSGFKIDARRVARDLGLRVEVGDAAAALIEHANRKALNAAGRVWVWPSNRRLADVLGCSPRSVARRLGVLEAAGLISRPGGERGGQSAKRNRNNAIDIGPLARRCLGDTSRSPADRKCHLETPEVSSRPPGSVIYKEPHQNPESNHTPPASRNRQSGETDPEGLQADPEGSKIDLQSLNLDQLADLFLRTYPQTAGPHRPARLALINAVRSGVEPRLIFRAAYRLARAVNAAPDQARYIPYPHRWIEDAGWETVQALIDRIDANRAFDPTRPISPNEIAG